MNVQEIRSNLTTVAAILVVVFADLPYSWAHIASTAIAAGIAGGHGVPVVVQSLYSRHAVSAPAPAARDEGHGFDTGTSDNGDTKNA